LLGALLGGAAAGYANQGFSKIVSASVNTDAHTMLEGVFAEMIIAFFLVFTVLSVGTSEKVAGNSYFGIAIGFAVLGGMVSVGDIVPGSAFNLALAAMLPLITNYKIGHVWVFIVGDLCGSLIAFGLYAYWHDILKIQQNRSVSKNHSLRSPLLDDHD
jgi:aquaporin Z